MKNRYNINRPKPRNGHKHNKYKMCLSIATPTQHLKLNS